MMQYFSRARVAFSLLLAILGITAQSSGQAPKPVIYSTLPKPVTAKLSLTHSPEKAKTSETGGYTLRGQATLTIAAANDNDTITGTFIYSIPDDARQKIAQVSGKPLNAIPAIIIKRDVVAGFQSGTTCPVLHLEIRGLELEIVGLKATFNRIVLDIIETQDQIPQLFCTWTRQINAKRQRRGIVAAINRLISPEQ